MTTKHATRLMETPDRERVEIDCGIAHLIKALWAKYIRTTFCCKGGAGPGLTGLAYIVFADEESFNQFKDMQISVPGSRWESGIHEFPPTPYWVFRFPPAASSTLAEAVWDQP